MKFSDLIIILIVIFTVSGSHVSAVSSLAEIGFSFRGSDQNLDPRKGTTKFYDLQLAYNQKQWGVETFYQAYPGATFLGPSVLRTLLYVRALF